MGGILSGEVQIMALSNLDVRLYDSAGKRMYFPMARILSVSFTIGERGGYLDGEVQVEGKWEEFTFNGTERIDVWENGALVYRGIVMTPRIDMNDAERVMLATYGLLTRLDKFIVTKRFAYAFWTDVGQVFADIANEFVILTDRLPSLTLDTTGVSGLGIALEDFDAKHKSVKDAFNQLCDNSPNALIWGFDVDGSGNDRLYLRPRSSAVSHVVAIGEGVSGFVYPMDAGQVVNRVYVDGGAVSYPNLVPNPSFEDPASVTDAGNNLLQNDSFEQQTDSGSRQNAAYWNRANGAVRRQYPDDNPGSGNLSHTGNCYVEMTTPNATFEQVNIPLGFPQPFTLSIWGRQNTNGDAEYFQMIVKEKNAAGTVVNTLTSANLTPASNAYQFFTQVFTPANAATTQVDIQFKMLSAGGTGHGVILDDARATLNNIQAASWGAGTNVNGIFSTLDWQSQDYAYDGAQSVKVVPSVTGGGYVEIQVLPQNRVDIQPGKTTYMTVWAYGAAGTIALGWREYADSTLTSTLVMALPEGVNAFGWTRHQFSFTSGTTTNKIQPFIRIFDSGGSPVYLDAVMITQGAAPPNNVFYEAGVFQGVRSVTDYTTGDIGSGAAGSLATYGLREKRESVEQVVDVATLDLYCKAYFKAYGTPVVQGEITLEDPSENFTIDGTIRLVNLPNAPAALFPSKATYRYGANLQVKLQLNNELPTLAQLLKNAAKSNALSSSSTGGGGSNAGGGGTAYPSPGGAVLSVQADSNAPIVGAVSLLTGEGAQLTQAGQNITVGASLSRRQKYRLEGF
jgi:hypothetical protein